MFWQFELASYVRIEAIDRADHRRAAAAAQGGKLLGLFRWIPNERRLRRWKVMDAIVIWRIISGRFDVIEVACFAFHKIKPLIGFVRSREVRPAKVPGCARLVNFVIAVRSNSQVSRNILADVTPIDKTRFGVLVLAEAVAHAHGEDFRPAVFAAGEQVSWRNRITSFWRRTNANDLPAQAHRVGGGSLRIHVTRPGTLIDRQLRDWIHVVPCAEQQVPICSHEQTSALVRARPIIRIFEEDSFRTQVEQAIFQTKARQTHAVRVVFRREEKQHLLGPREVAV